MDIAKPTEWEDLMGFLQYAIQDPDVVDIWLKDNRAAVGMIPEHHVAVDIFIFYSHENPSLETCRKVIAPLDEKKMIWDGLNVGNLWKDPTVYLYGTLLHWPPEKETTIDQGKELAKLGFKRDGGGKYYLKKNYAGSWEEKV